jgi:hypothetical protein
MRRLGSQVSSIPSGKLKRKVGYEEEEIAETRAKLNRMDLDSET